jgi:hypothetical protein
MARLAIRATGDRRAQTITAGDAIDLELRIGNTVVYRLKFHHTGMLTGYDKDGYSYSIAWPEYQKYVAYKEKKHDNGNA